jgi:glutamate N-acetyltransferase / amino-acid N-acetyltransferase
MAVGAHNFPIFPEISGVRIGVVEAGIKKQNRKDLVLFEFGPSSKVAGVFTKNAFCAAPVHISKQHLAYLNEQSGSAYFLINTGNANAGTGKQGFVDADTCCESLAEHLACEPERVLPFSTGVIGEKLPVEKICSALPELVHSLAAGSWAGAATGIMTTDTRAKGATASVSYAGQTLTINGISKGAGMIKPNMATMLCFVATDAKVSQELLSRLTSEIADQTFNRITIDGDTSTNDACMLVASGESSAPEIDESHEDFSNFKVALHKVFLDLSHAIVRDGEGATKFVTIRVEQAQSQQEALDVAYTIAHSPLVKTALFASDPNWGRILAALGRSPIEDFDLSKVSIALGDVLIVEQGGKSDNYTEELGQEVMNQEEITITVNLERGAACETIWTADLSHDYVTINAEYRT